MTELKRSIYFISFPIGFIGFIFPIYASSFGTSIMEIGYLYSIFSLTSIIIRPMVGNIIDQRGRRIGVIIGIVFYTIVNLIFLLANNFSHLLIARTVQSIGGSFLWISVDTIISDISNSNNRGKNFGSMDESISKGHMTGVTIGFTILFNNFGKNPFKIIFIVFLLTSLISLYYGIKTIPETIHYKNDFAQGKIKKDIRVFLVITSLISFVTSFTVPIFLIYLHDNITKDLSTMAYLFLPASILSMYLPNKFGSFSDKYGREKTILIGLFLLSILQFLIPLNKTLFSFTAIYTLISLVSMFYSPAFDSIVIDFIGEEKRGKSYGQYNLALGIGSSIGPVLGSYIYNNLGNDMVFFIQGGLLLCITTLLFFIYIKNFNNLYCRTL